MPTLHLAVILLCVAGISAGQVLFKIAALKSLGPDYESGLWKIIFNPYMVTGVFIYAMATLLWVWSLRVVPLNLAYPFMALAFIFVPLLSFLFIGEPLKANLLYGSLMIIFGLYLVAR